MSYRNISVCVILNYLKKNQIIFFIKIIIKYLNLLAQKLLLHRDIICGWSRMTNE